MKFTALIIILAACLPAPRARAQPVDLGKIKLDQHPGAALPLKLTFRDAAGNPMTLAACIDHKPTLLMLGYYKCPMLCNLMLEDLPRSLKGVPLRIGRDYQFVMVSIAPSETPDLAAERKNSFIAGLKGAPGDSGDSEGDSAAQGVRMLTGSAAAIQILADAAGYGFAYDAQSRQYAHPTALIALTPEGKISRYLLGMQFASRDLRLALVEAGQGRTGSIADGIILHCYQFDPATGTYGLAIMTALRIGGGLTVAMLAGLIAILTIQKRKIDRRRAAEANRAT